MPGNWPSATILFRIFVVVVVFSDNRQTKRPENKRRRTEISCPHLHYDCLNCCWFLSFLLFFLGIVLSLSSLSVADLATEKRLFFLSQMLWGVSFFLYQFHFYSDRRFKIKATRKHFVAVSECDERNLCVCVCVEFAIIYDFGTSIWDFFRRYPFDFSCVISLEPSGWFWHFDNWHISK